MDLDQATTRPEEPTVADSLGEDDACSDMMDITDDDVEMGIPPEVTTDVEMALRKDVTGRDDLVLGDWDAGEGEDTVMLEGRLQ